MNITSYSSHIVIMTVLVLAATLPHFISAQEVDKPRFSVPPTREQISKLKEIEQALELSKATTANRKQQAIKSLLEMAQDPAVTAEELYALLNAAYPLINDMGSVDSLRRANQILIETFDVDPVLASAEHQLAFMKVAKTRTSLENVTDDLIENAQQLSLADRFADANALLDAADEHATRLNSKIAGTRIDNARQHLKNRYQAYTAAEASRELLKKDSNDPGANFRLGHWLIAYEGKLDEALPFLRKGDQPTWSAAADAEERTGKDDATIIAAADAWWDVSEQTGGPGKLAAQRRAFQLYTEVELGPLSPLVKIRVTKRKSELAGIVESSDRPGGPSPSASKTGSEDLELPINEPIDLMALVKLPQHNILGTWEFRDQKIFGHAYAGSRFMFPVVATGSYQFTCRFVRTWKQDNIAINFPTGSSHVSLNIDNQAERFSGFTRIDGDGMSVNDGVFASRQKGPYTNDFEHELQVDVTQKGNVVSLEGTIDGKKIYTWRGNDSRLSALNWQCFPVPHVFGFSSYDSTVQVNSAVLVLKPGAKGYRLRDDWKNPLDRVDDKPPSRINRQCEDWGGKKYFFFRDAIFLSEAQELASRLNGRLLTISSKDEEDFIRSKSAGQYVFTAGWCTPTRKWVDERNRPLKYIGKWKPGQPDDSHRIQNLIWFDSGTAGGWDDVDIHQKANVVIEWGEEYPGGDQTGDK